MATIYALAGEPFQDPTQLEGAPSGVTDWEILIYEAWEGSGSDAVGAPFTGPIEEIEVGDTGTVIYSAVPTAPVPPDDAELDANARVRYTVVWELDGETSDPDVLLVGSLPVAGEFASLTDLAIMLGKTNVSELTAAQTLQGTMYLGIATGLITEAVNRDAAWAAALDPVPLMLRAVCLTAVKRVMDNPTGARSESETLGQHSHSVSYTDGAHGLMLTDAEVTLCRRAVLGATSASACVDSLATTIAVTHGSDDWGAESNPAIYEDIT